MSVVAGGTATGVVLRQHTGLTESEDQPGRTPVGGALMHSGERRNEAATRANVQGRLRDRLHEALAEAGDTGSERTCKEMRS